MRRTIRSAVSVGAAAVIIATLSSASLPPAVASNSGAAAVLASSQHGPARSLGPARSAQDLPTGATQLAQTLAMANAIEAAAEKRAAAAHALVLAASHAHTVHVWTRGFQLQVNQCRGGVDMTAHYGMRIVAEHWSCGGSAFPTAHGTLVRLTGHDAGIYRVIGVVATLNAYTSHTYQVPNNYPLLYQTCRGGDSHYTEFIALKRVG